MFCLSVSVCCGMFMSLLFDVRCLRLLFGVRCLIFVVSCMLFAVCLSVVCSLWLVG